MWLVLSAHSGAAGSRRQRRRSTTGNDRCRGVSARDGGSYTTPNRTHSLQRAGVVLSRADCALDVRNDEFGLCEVNNTKMDRYPEHAPSRSVAGDGTGPPAGHG